MIKEWFINRFRAAAPKGSIEAPVDKGVKMSPYIHVSTREFINYTASAISRLDELDKLMSAPKVEYIKGFHTKGTMAPIKGLGVISVIFNSETGCPLFAELEEIEND